MSIPPVHNGKTCGYIVLINGHLGDSLTDWFQDVELISRPDGNTLIIGNDLDQAALFGMLLFIRDLGIQILLVARRDLQETEACRLNLEIENN